jgi:glycerophosphoryl diester phosphodiesterase
MRVIAHRGASAYAPELTFAAFDLALAMGADTLELDVRLTADGELVLLHDRTLARTAHDARRIDRLTLADLERLPEEVRPVTLDAVFARYGADTRYWVETKEPVRDTEHALVAVIERHGLREHAAVQSSDHRSLRRLRRLHPHLRLAPIYRRGTHPAFVRAGLARTAGYACAIVPAAALVDAALVHAAHARGLTVHAWTVNDEREMARLEALGVDAVITDVPDRALAVAGTAAPALKLAA